MEFARSLPFWGPKSKPLALTVPVIRRWHIWAGLVSAIPALLIVATGIVLLLRKNLPAIHPPTLQGVRPGIERSFPEVLLLASQVTEADIHTVADVTKAEALPGKGIWKVRSRNGWEVQLDAHTGKVLGAQPRHTSWIIALHEGSYFSSGAMYAIYLPAAILMLALWFSGIYLYWKRR